MLPTAMEAVLAQSGLYAEAKVSTVEEVVDLAGFIRVTGERLAQARQSSDSEARIAYAVIEGSCNEAWHKYNKTAEKLGLTG